MDFKDYIQLKKTKAKVVVCANCSGIGHKKVECKEPIISAGLICYRLNGATGDLSLLLVRRKHTIAFIEFIRGHYTLRELDTITSLLKRMTPDERKNIATHSFYKLWCITWNNMNTKKYKREFDRSKIKFDKLKRGYRVNRTTVMTLEELIKSNSCYLTEPEWGFPKGRRNGSETNVTCAKREFMEETNYVSSDFVVEPEIDTLIEEFKGTNGKMYRYIYYLARCRAAYDPVVDPFNKHQQMEIGDIAWFSYKECEEKFRSIPSKRKILKEIFYTLSSEYNTIEIQGPQMSKFEKNKIKPSNRWITK